MTKDFPRLSNGKNKKTVSYLDQFKWINNLKKLLKLFLKEK